MKLFQLMVEHTPDEENIDWTKIEPSVNFLKSPKGTCVQPLLAWVAWRGARPGASLGKYLWSSCPCLVQLWLWLWPGLLDQQSVLISSCVSTCVCCFLHSVLG